LTTRLFLTQPPRSLLISTMSTKVFVGNLAFRTTDQALQEAFSKHGEVKSGVIITRGRRSLGYGFVEFVNAEQAAASVDKMNKAEIFGRQIKVELAKDLVERPDQQNDEVGPAKRRKRAGDDGNDSPSGKGSNTTTTTTNTDRSGGNNRGNSNANASSANAGNSDDKESDRRRNPRRRRNNNSTGKPNGNPADNNNTSGGGAPSGPSSRPPREPREPREPRDDKEKVLSKTTLFVANLPFSVDDAQLLAAFVGTKAKAAHVVVTNSGRSRGYGFVEFDTEADQTEALKTHNGKSIVGKTGPRNMSVSISHTPPPTSDAPATSN